MNFTTPCFVREPDPTERKELYEWCVSIGYKSGHYPTPNRHITAGATAVYGYRMISEHNTPTYDCGTNVALFKALAAMNDSNDFMQWFIHRNANNVGRTSWKLCEKHNSVYRPGWRKATTAEIIERFKSSVKL